MVYTYTPAYYSSFQDSITSICKTILPFSFKKRGLPPSERKLSKQHSDYLKWQQNSFHRILNLMGLHKEGILPESEVSDFKSRLLDTLIASTGTDSDQPVILRDKLLFLQELLYAKCISDEEYQSSKRCLLQRLAVLGAEIESRDVNPGNGSKEICNEEWSVIDLKEENCSNQKDSKSKLKHGSSAMRNIKGVVLGFGGGSSQKQGKGRGEKSIFDKLSSNGTPNRNEGAVLECDKAKKKGFLRMFSKEERDEKKLLSGYGEGPDTKKMKKKLHSDGSASDFFIDKVLGDNIKKELTRIQTELSTTNTNHQFSNDEMETISTKLPVDNADLQKFFPKSWCDRHGEVVLDVVKKEFKGHVREMESSRHSTRERKNSYPPSKWATFDDCDDSENSHPNLFCNANTNARSTNPFLDEDQKIGIGANRLQNQSFSNPFWNSSDLH